MTSGFARDMSKSDDFARKTSLGKPKKCHFFRKSCDLVSKDVSLLSQDLCKLYTSFLDISTIPYHISHNLDIMIISKQFRYESYTIDEVYGLRLPALVITDVSKESRS